ncbi:MAG: hypothetical protein IKV16_02755 [Clostridia bacterium]|nr:hypothetical protein [Clostridia bacterium]
MKRLKFFENAKLLFDRFGIIPLMYGSLGLEYITGEALGADDVDILIPEVFVKGRWGEISDFLSGEGYVLTDEHEHTFEKYGISFSYASIEELESFAGIKISDIEERSDSGARFGVLNLEQYLKVYRASAKDGYRITVREKKDNEKIAFIEERMR